MVFTPVSVSAFLPPPKSDSYDWSFVPRFTGDSFLELPTLKHVGKEFEIEVWFLAYRPTGMLLYNGQHPNGDGDFLSLNLVGSGNVQLRYDLGSGLANLTTPEAVTLGTWHVAKISRNGPRGRIQLDEGEVVSGSSHKPLTELNLEMPLYIGGYRLVLYSPISHFQTAQSRLPCLLVNDNVVKRPISVVITVFHCMWLSSYSPFLEKCFSLSVTAMLLRRRRRPSKLPRLSKVF